MDKILTTLEVKAYEIEVQVRRLREVKNKLLSLLSLLDELNNVIKLINEEPIEARIHIAENMVERAKKAVNEINSSLS